MKVQDTDGKPIAKATANVVVYQGTAGISITRPPAVADEEGRIQIAAPAARQPLHDQYQSARLRLPASHQNTAG